MKQSGILTDAGLGCAVTVALYTHAADTELLTGPWSLPSKFSCTKESGGDHLLGGAVRGMSWLRHGEAGVTKQTVGMSWLKHGKAGVTMQTG